LKTPALRIGPLGRQYTIVSVVVEEGALSVGQMAFAECTQITEIILLLSTMNNRKKHKPTIPPDANASGGIFVCWKLHQ